MFNLKRKPKSKKKRGLSDHPAPTVNAFQERQRKEQQKRSWLIKVTGLLSLVVVVAGLYIGAKGTDGQERSYIKDDILPAEILDLGKHACGQNDQEICYYIIYKYTGMHLTQGINVNTYRNLQGKRTVKIVTSSSGWYIAGTEPGSTDYRADLLCAFGAGLSILLFPIFMWLYKRL